MNAQVKPIFNYIDEHFNRHLEKVRTFVMQPSISGEGVGMAEVAELVAGAISELGGRSEVVPTSGWPVVYGEINVARALRKDCARAVTATRDNA